MQRYVLVLPVVESLSADFARERRPLADEREALDNEINPGRHGLVFPDVGHHVAPHVERLWGDEGALQALDLRHRAQAVQGQGLVA